LHPASSERIKPALPSAKQTTGDDMFKRDITNKQFIEAVAALDLAALSPKARFFFALNARERNIKPEALPPEVAAAIAGHRYTPFWDAANKWLQEKHPEPFPAIKLARIAASLTTLIGDKGRITGGTPECIWCLEDEEHDDNIYVGLTDHGVWLGTGMRHHTLCEIIGYCTLAGIPWFAPASEP
jgi:hypothetical protein